MYYNATGLILYGSNITNIGTRLIVEKGNEEYSIYLILIFYLVMIQIFIALK